MSNRIFTSLFLLCIFSFNVSAKNDNPFAKTESLDIGKDISWKADPKAKLATKTISGSKGTYYHLKFNNKQLELLVTSDAGGQKPKKFNQLEIKDVKIDGKRSSLFSWCLKNQERHSRFLQQGLKVKKDICVTDGNTGSFVMNLNKQTLTSLQKGEQLLIMLKPFRTPLELHYDLSDFQVMYTALNANTAPVAKVAVPVKAATSSRATVSAKKTCSVNPPAKYKSIKSVKYVCTDAAAKQNAESKVNNLVSQEKAKEKKAAAEKEKQKKLAEEKKQQEIAAQLEQEKLLKVEAAAIAASEAKQAAIGGEIAQKMLKVCEKYWNKGEHRCYCQKYIEYAPSEIQANSSCK
ncbi:MAG: hypothetical protein ACC650_00515 [Gammaproteobacteria bacterium]